MAGTNADRIFISSLEDIIQTTWTNYFSGNDEDEDENYNEDVDEPALVHSMQSSNCIANIHDQVKRRNSVNF